MNHDDIVKAADGLTDSLAEIDNGELQATPTQRAYIAGAEHALRAVLGEEELDVSLVS
ncbi:MAG: hypothetical protein ABI566_04545 [Pseudolysinimonas sp.]